MQYKDGALLVIVAGELDIATAGELRECLVRPDVLSAPKVHLDLTTVSFLDSAGIGMIVAASKRVRQSGGAFSVIAGDNAVRRVLEVAGLIEYLEVDHRGAGRSTFASAALPPSATAKTGAAPVPVSDAGGLGIPASGGKTFEDSPR
jgi:anti-sigma B factor antagonist